MARNDSTLAPGGAPGDLAHCSGARCTSNSWATAHIDKGDALIARSGASIARDSLLRDATEHYEIALLALNRDSEPSLSMLWARATVSLAKSLRGHERLHGLRKAVGALSEDQFEGYRLMLVSELRTELVESGGSVSDVCVAFESEIALLEEHKEDGYWHRWREAQTEYGRWLARASDPETALPARFRK